MRKSKLTLNILLPALLVISTLDAQQRRRPVPPERNSLEPCSDYPVLFDDDSFRGRSFPLQDSVRDLGEEGFGDRASSVCVPYGWTVFLYSDDGFGGDRLEIQGPATIADLRRDRPDGRDWGDRISSAEVLYRRPDSSLPRDCDRIPILFSDDGYRGRQMRLQQDSDDLHRQGLGDRASSVCVPRGWVVTLWEDTRFRGDRLEIRGPGSFADLKRDRPDGQDWGDRISSAQVSDRRRDLNLASECGQVPMLFSDDGFRGGQLSLNRSVENLHRQGFGDRASSICVPRGWVIIVYEDTEFRGESLELRGPEALRDLGRDQPRGQDWGDRISSVQVRRESYMERP